MTTSDDEETTKKSKTLSDPSSCDHASRPTKKARLQEEHHVTDSANLLQAPPSSQSQLLTNTNTSTNEEKASSQTSATHGGDASAQASVQSTTSSVTGVASLSAPGGLVASGGVTVNPLQQPLVPHPTSRPSIGGTGVGMPLGLPIRSLAMGLNHQLANPLSATAATYPLTAASMAARRATQEQAGLNQLLRLPSTLDPYFHLRSGLYLSSLAAYAGAALGSLQQQQQQQQQQQGTQFGGPSASSLIGGNRASNSLVAGRPNTANAFIPPFPMIGSPLGQTAVTSTHSEEDNHQHSRVKSNRSRRIVGSNRIGGASSQVVEGLLSRQQVASLPNLPETLPVILALDKDKSKLSSYQLLLRNQIEVFSATNDDVTTHARGRNKKITHHQVGIRCRHCKELPGNLRKKGSVYYPFSLIGLYQAAQNMGSSHFHSNSCPNIPTEIKEKFVEVMDRKSTVGAGKQYWARSAQELGLVDTDLGIRFIRDLGDDTISEETKTDHSSPP